MTNPKKQLKITKMFKKGGGGTRIQRNHSIDDCDDLQEEVRQLELQLRSKKDELFQIQRNAYIRKASPVKAVKDREDSFVRPQKIILTNSIETLKRRLELMSMLTGVEIQSYVAGEHCCVVFHMQHDTTHAISHGLRIEMQSGKNEVAESSLPLGFNLSAILEEFDNVMKPDCLRTIRKALVAYYDRLEQFQALKKLVNVGAELFKTLDGSHMQLTMFVQNVDAEEDPFQITLKLDYRVYDIRPKNIQVEVMDLEIAEEVQACLDQQCVDLKKKPLQLAFEDAFCEIGPYKLVHQMRPLPSEQHRRRPKHVSNKHRYNDDTFHPEECSEQSDDEDYAV